LQSKINQTDHKTATDKLQMSFTFFFQTCLPVQQPSCSKNELKSVVLR